MSSQVTSKPNSWIDIKTFSKLFFTLGLLSLSIYFFNIESDLKLFELIKILVPGFLIYSYLPIKFRLPFLFLLNAVACCLLFGLVPGLSILAVCALFFGVTEMKVSWNIRVAIILGLTAGLVLMRTEVISWADSTLVATVAGVLLMFRTILYLYEIQYLKEDPGFWKKINYFFLLPNLVFFIFPIVDYKTFIRNYYDRQSKANITQGLKWMFTGVIHLLVYRLLYYYVIPSPEEVNNIYSLLYYMFISYALIIRLSGLFHFSAGVICLFGFNIPETFNNYFLARNFSELWRKINIYWKDFVMKIFYYPIYFKFKNRNTTAIFITVLIVFFFNWFLHAYQWFWIRGNFLLKENDIIFWALLGVFVATNSVIQKNAKRKAISSSFVLKEAGIDSMKIIGMLIAMSVLWTFWISPSISEWYDFMTGISTPGVLEILTLIGSFIALVGVGVGLHFLYYAAKDRFTFSPRIHSPPLMLVNIVLAALVVFGIPRVNTELEDRYNLDLEPVFTSMLNKADQDLMFQGYYDELIAGNNLNSRIWEFEQEKPEGWGKLQTTGIFNNYNHLLDKDLKPNKEIVFKNKKFTTNEHGMRDKSYSKAKPDNTLRIGLLGGSMEIGSGVADKETYENVMEQRLNKSGLFTNAENVEVLNFAISGIHMPQHVPITEKKLRPFQPDVLIYTAHTSEIFRSLRKFSAGMRSPAAINEYPYLRSLAQELGINRSMSERDARLALEDYKEELYTWGLERIAKVCKEDNILPILIYIQTLGDDPVESEHIRIKEMAESLGFYFIDLHTIFEGVNQLDFATAIYDKHPNARGHKRIARYLINEFRSNRELFDKINNAVK